MKKIFVIVVFLCGLCLYDAAAQENIKFSADMPSEIAAGESYDVQLSVEKPNIYGRFQLILSFSEKFVVDEIVGSSAGAEFEWDGIQAHYRWNDLAEERITIAYRVSVPAEAADEVKTDGVFVYYQNGEREREYITLPVVKIKKMDDNETFDDESSTEPHPVEKPPVLDIIQNVEPESKPIVVDSEPHVEQPLEQPPNYAGNVYVIRQTPYRENGKFIVRLQINKGSFGGYGCLVEWITPHGRINPREQKNASVEIFENESEIHFTWENMPHRDTITLMYEVESADAITANGFFYFGNSGAQDSVAVEQRQTTITKDLPVPDEMPTDISPNIIAGSRTDDDSGSKSCEIKRSKGERGLMYKIQVLAWRKELGCKEIKERLKKKHIDIRDEISEDYVQDGSGFPYKYVVGHFRSFEQASILRDYLQRTFGYDADGRPKAFLVCYYNGNRITVQEALLIQNRQR